jgi:acetyl-CoA carboxylase biotin carboxylase subunit
LFSGYAVPQYYDSLVAKVIAHGGDRTECVARMRRALGEMFISGINTLIPLHQALCDNDDIIHNNVHVKWLENVFFKSGENALKKMVG